MLKICTIITRLHIAPQKTALAKNLKKEAGSPRIEPHFKQQPGGRRGGMPASTKEVDSWVESVFK